MEGMSDTIPAEVLGRAVSGRNLRRGTFGDQLGTRPVFLVFLRHFG
jgi:hypothetical protein